VKSGNEVHFFTNAEFVRTHTSRANKRSDTSPYRVSSKLPRPINMLRGLLREWLNPGRLVSGSAEAYVNSARWAV
jgi:hypothetical protein